MKLYYSVYGGSSGANDWVFRIQLPNAQTKIDLVWMSITGYSVDAGAVGFFEPLLFTRISYVSGLPVTEVAAGLVAIQGNVLPGPLAFDNLKDFNGRLALKPGDTLEVTVSAVGQFPGESGAVISEIQQAVFMYALEFSE